MLPDALGRALDAFERFTGKSVHVVRNLTPEVENFNGITFRDGHLYVDERSENPVTTTAAHEFTHQLRQERPDLYNALADEVRRQGRMDKWQQELSRRSRGESTHLDAATEELTGNAVGDALSDPDFLNRMAQRNPGKFREMAQRFIDFLNTFLGRTRDLGSNQYLTDVAAFRDKLADVLDRYSARDGDADGGDPAFQRVFHGTPHRGIENEGFKLNKIGTGEGSQVYGHGVYFAKRREVAEWYRKALQSVTRAGNYYNGKRLTSSRMAEMARNGSDVERRVFGAKWPRTGIRAEMERRANEYEAEAKIKDGNGTPISKEWAQTYRRRAADIRSVLSNIEVRERTENGQLYHAEIPEDHELLDWDKPHAEQPEKVRQALAKLNPVVVRDGNAWIADRNLGPASPGDEVNFWHGMIRRGSSAYNALSIVRGGPEAASEALRDAGIPGLRYLDGVSRDKGEGTHNYVIWDEKHLNNDVTPYFSRTASTRDGYEKRIDELFDGKAPNREGVRMLDEGDALTVAGYGKMPVVVNESHAVGDGRYNHGLTREQWKRMPEWIDNPAAVFERNSDGHLTMIGPEKANGHAVVIGLEPSASPPHRSGGEQRHLVLTAYAKDRGTLSLRAAIADGDYKPVYVDEKKGPSFYAGSGIDFPGRAAELRASNRTLRTERDLVKYRAGRSAANPPDDTPRFSRADRNAEAVDLARRIANPDATLAEHVSRFIGQHWTADDLVRHKDVLDRIMAHPQVQDAIKAPAPKAAPAEKTTGVKNERVDAAREERGAAPLETSKATSKEDRVQNTCARHERSGTGRTHGKAIPPATRASGGFTMIDALLNGKLAADPKAGTTKTGNPYATCRVWASIGAEDRLSVSVIAFDAATVTGLLALGTGDAVALAGELTPKVWTDKAGTVRPSADLKAHSLLTAYHVTRKRKAMADESD